MSLYTTVPSPKSQEIFESLILFFNVTLITGWNQYIYPGIDEPTILFNIDFTNVVGNYLIWIYVCENETGEMTELIRESYTWTNQDIYLEYSFGEEDLPDIEEVYFYQFQIEMELGSWSSMDQTSSVIYG